MPPTPRAQMSARLEAQLSFLTEADALKSVVRANEVLDRSRFENSAEHSWHLALYALVLAPYAGPDVQLHRVIAMVLLHDLVEIDVGDHPIHLHQDHVAVAKAEAAAATRLFGLLPTDQAAELLALWHEFEAAQTLDARFAKQLDHIQPMFQVLLAATPRADHLDVVRDNLATGRAARLAQEWPEIHALCLALLQGPLPVLAAPPGTCPDLWARLTFLSEADQLKLVLRATTLCDASRHENSGEHSWHIALYTLILSEHAIDQVDVARVVQMLVLHDLVEIDAGDAPIHGTYDPAAQDALESAAARRLYGLLPAEQGAQLHGLWRAFEDTACAESIFAKSIDRVQPLIANLETGGGSWPAYNVTKAQLISRVGTKVARGAPAVWNAIEAQIDAWFADRG
jgi:putative hydrolase of HD superfamily